MTVCEQLNDEAANFAVYAKADLSEKFSAKATAERYLVYDTSKGSILFNLSKGTSSHPDGEVYERTPTRRLGQGSRWTVVVDIRGGEKGGSVYVKEWEMPTGLKGLQGTDGLRDASDRCYNLAGQQVGNHRFAKGVYIVGNKKVVVR